MSRLRRLLNDDIDSFDLRSLALTAVALTLCLIAVTVVQNERHLDIDSSALVQEPFPAR
jgi:hypothetical protein